MPVTNKTYPDWVQEYRTRGKTVKKKGDAYYLYSRSSKRIPGKKYPQPVDTYIGLITPDGIVESDKRKITLSDVSVREYGFSWAMQKLCPESWKDSLGKDWQDVLDIIIVKWSADSYLQDMKHLKQESDFRYQFAAQMSMLSRKIYKEYHVEMKELEMLKGIYLVSFGKEQTLSKLRPQQQAMLDRLGLELEAD